jgi:hypothetical protein
MLSTLRRDYQRDKALCQSKISVFCFDTEHNTDENEKTNREAVYRNEKTMKMVLDLLIYLSAL